MYLLKRKQNIFFKDSVVLAGPQFKAGVVVASDDGRP